MKNIKLAILALVAVVLVLVSAPAIWASPAMSGIRGKIQCFTEDGDCVEGWNGVDIQLYSDAGSTEKFAVEGSLGDVDMSGTMRFAPTTSTSTGATNVTPAGYTFLEVAPQTTLTITLVTSSAEEGDLLIVANTVSTSTIIVDTGATQGGGNITLGQDDLAGFIYLDGVWIELFSPDNS